MYFDPYVDPQSSLAICRENSILCHRADSYIRDGESFCKALGHRVDQTENCFRGEFKVGTKYSVMPR